MKLQVAPVLPAEPELHLLTEYPDEERGRRLLWAAIGTVVVHVFLYFVAVVGAEYIPPPSPRNNETLDLHKAIPLILPPDLLTQKQPNRAKVSKELSLENLTARPAVRPVPRVFSPPPAAPANRAASPAAPQLEAPQINVAQAPPPPLGNVPNAPAPPPQAPPQTQPKLAFETPGAPPTKAPGTGTIQVPKTGVQEAIRSVGHQGTGAVAVGDVGADLNGGVGQISGQPGSSGRQASSLELMSDPMGIDFKPYLIRVLAAVRRNWMAVVPESARYGRRGKVIIQFSIDHTGSVPKLVIVTPSGTDAFDRAAVAGVSASNPFPPLPDGFRGNIVRLQLAFFYNIPSR